MLHFRVRCCDPARGRCNAGSGGSKSERKRPVRGLNACFGVRIGVRGRAPNLVGLGPDIQRKPAMVDDRQADAPSAADAARAKREGPTIELEATEVSSKAVADEPKPDAAAEPPKDATPSEPATSSKPSSKPTPAWIVAPFSGVVGAGLVIGVGALLGWPNLQAPPPAPPVSAAVVDDLTARLAALEGKVNKQEAALP